MEAAAAEATPLTGETELPKPVGGAIDSLDDSMRCKLKLPSGNSWRGNLAYASLFLINQVLSIIHAVTEIFTKLAKSSLQGIRDCTLKKEK